MGAGGEQPHHGVGARRLPGDVDRRFSSLVESRGTEPLDLVVERAMYSRAGITQWAAGTDALGTLLPDPGKDGSMGSGPAGGDGVTPPTRPRARPAETRARSPYGAAGDLSALVVTFSLAGTASAQDIRALSGQVAFPSGVTAMAVNVDPLDDTTAELPETLVLTLFAGAQYQVGAPGSAQVVIADDDQASVEVPAALSDAARFLTQATFGPTHRRDPARAVDGLRGVARASSSRCRRVRSSRTSTRSRRVRGRTAPAGSVGPVRRHRAGPVAPAGRARAAGDPRRLRPQRPAGRVLRAGRLHGRADGGRVRQLPGLCWSASR